MFAFVVLFVYYEQIFMTCDVPVDSFRAFLSLKQLQLYISIASLIEGERQSGQDDGAK